MTLVLVTTIGAIVSILGLAMIHLGYHSRMLAARNVQSVTARCAADAGMADAIFRMQKKIVDELDWDDSTIPTASNVNLAGANSDYSYSISGTSSTGYRIDATGTSGPATRTTHAGILVGSYWKGIGVEEHVEVRLGASLGAVGPYADQGLEVRSNSTAANEMVFKAFLTVPGDVVCGPGGDPNVVIDTKNSTVIEGECYAATETLLFPDVQAPEGLPAKPAIDLGTNGMKVLTGGGDSGMYPFISLGQGATLQVTGAVTLYVIGPMILGQGSEVVIADSGSLTVYLATRLEDKNSVGFSNQTYDATKLKIYGLPSCTDIDLKAMSRLDAAVYAPDARVDVYNSGDFYGAVTAHDLYLKNAGNFYFDTRLMYVNIDDPAAVFVIGRWWEN